MSLIIDLDEQSAYWIVKVVGDLDFAGRSAFQATISRIVDGAPPAVIVGLTGVEYLDSSGLGLLLLRHKEYVGIEHVLVLVSNEIVDGILSLTRLIGVLATATGMEQALRMIATDLRRGS